MSEEIIEADKPLSGEDDPTAVKLAESEPIIQDKFELSDSELEKLTNSNSLSGEEETVGSIIEFIKKSKKERKELTSIACKCSCGCSLAILAGFHKNDICGWCEKGMH